MTNDIESEAGTVQVDDACLLTTINPSQVRLRM